MAGDSWQAPVDITSSAQNVAFAPRVAVDAQGNAVVIWQRRVGPNYVIQGAVRPVDGAWEEPVELSGAGPNEDDPELAVDPQGNAYAVWQHRDGPGSGVQGAVRPAGGAWQEPVTLSAPGRPAEGAQIAVDPHGNAFAIWVGSDGTHSIVHSAVRPAGGTWQGPVDLSAAGEDAEDPQVAVDAQGDAVAVWARSSVTDTIVQGATRPAGQAWGAPVDLSTTAGRIPQVGVDAQGNAVAVWARIGRNVDHEDGSVRYFYNVQSAVRPAGEAWQPSVALSEVYDELSARVAVGPQGTAVAMWQYRDFTDYGVQGAALPAGGTWHAAVDFASNGGGAPQAAVDAQGNAVSIWETGSTVKAAGYDAAGPWLRSLSVPAAGVEGQELSFSVSPVDVWSKVAATPWSFGDGATATGTTVTHAYGQAGTYPISVSASDAVGNSTTATQPIAIASPAPAAPPEECVDPPGLLPCPPAEPAPATPTPATPQTSKPAGCPQSGRLTAGTTSDDTLDGTSRSDVLLGRGGNDILVGSGSRDCLYGGSGRDQLSGGAADDALFGGSGNDRLDGGAGNDRLAGQTGGDRMNGGSGRDRLDGAGGDDTLIGAGGTDTIIGAGGRDRLSGAPAATPSAAARATTSSRLATARATASTAERAGTA